MWGSRARTKKRKERHLVSIGSLASNINQHGDQLRQKKPEEINAAIAEIAELTTSIGKVQHGRKNIRKHRRLKLQLQRAEERLREAQQNTKVKQFAFRVAPIIENKDILSQNQKATETHKQQFRSIFLSIFRQQQSAPCFVDRDTCPKCNHQFQQFTRESQLICPNPKCGHHEQLLYCAGDFIQFENKPSKYERGPLYRKYLMQFCDSVAPPPPAVIATIMRCLSKVHIMLPSKTKPTPITQILRQQGLQKWTHMAVRISRMIKGEHIPLMSIDLIDRLVQRFNKITEAFALTKRTSRKKILNFEFLTKQFLLMEGRADLSSDYHLHKTRAVLGQAEERLENCCKVLQDDTLDWNTTRSC